MSEGSAAPIPFSAAAKPADTTVEPGTQQISATVSVTFATL